MPGFLTDVEQIIKQTTNHLERRLFVLAGPSGVGKNTIIKELLASHPDEMDRIRTYTTRARREDEIDGEQYHFVTPEKFRELALAGKLMEADAETVGHDVYGLGKLYSMPADLFEGIPEEKHIVIAEIDVVGTRRVSERYPNCVTIFVTAPPIDLVNRILKRRDRTMDNHSLAQRIETARGQIRAAKEFDYVVFNRKGDLDRTIAAIEKIIEVERMRVVEGFDLEAVLPKDAFDIVACDE
jgi:guanylate kinase